MPPRISYLILAPRLDLIKPIGDHRHSELCYPRPSNDRRSRYHTRGNQGSRHPTTQRLPIQVLEIDFERLHATPTMIIRIHQHRIARFYFERQRLEGGPWCDSRRINIP